MNNRSFEREREGRVKKLLALVRTYNRGDWLKMNRKSGVLN